jgi:hypothetical protein
MKSEDIANLLIAAQLLHSMLIQAAKVSYLIEKARLHGGSLSLEELKLIVQERDEAINSLEQAVQENSNG